MSLTDAFDDCLGDLRSVLLVDQAFESAKALSSTLFTLFCNALQLQSVEFHKCRMDREQWRQLAIMVGRWACVTWPGMRKTTGYKQKKVRVLINEDEVTIRFTADNRTQRATQRLARGTGKPRYQPRY